jgi:hypothetical protein
LAAAQESSAGRAAPSVAQARRIRQAEQQASRDEALLDFQRGQNAEQEGSLGAARVYYQMAARKAEGPLRQQIQERLDAIKTAPR